MEHLDTPAPQKNSPKILNMKYPYPLLSSLSLALSLSACGESTSDAEQAEQPPTRPEQDVGKEDSYYSCGFVEFPDEEKFPGHTQTSKRVQALTQYANDLLACTQPALDKTFSRRGVNVESISTLYEIKVEGDDCFTEQDRWGYDDDIDSDAELEALQQQVRSTVTFLKNLHEDLSGYPNRLFDTLLLCPEHIVDEEMALEGRKLYLGIDRSIFDNLKIQDAVEIRDNWSSGLHLKKQLAMLSLLWKVIDPAGSPRIMLRESISGAAQHLSDRLSELKPSSTEAIKVDLKQLIKDHTLDNYRVDGIYDESTEEQPDFKAEALAKIEAMDREHLHELISAWSDYIDNPDRWEGLNQTAASMHEASARNQINLDIQQVGFFAFANFHDINVDASFLFPASRDYTRYVRIEVLDWDVKVRQYALISIWTSDNVNVNVSVQVDRVLETKGLERALELLD